MKPIAAMRMRKTAPSNALPSYVRTPVIVPLTTVVSSGQLTLPTGMVAGDELIAFIAHSWNIVSVTWTGAHFNRDAPATGPNWNGMTISGVVDATDIARGYIGVGFGGGGYGQLIGIGFNGTKNYRDVGGLRDGSGAASRTVTSGGSVVAGDLLFLFGSAWTATDATSTSLPTQIAHAAHANTSGCAYFGYAASGGAQSGTINYAGSPQGDYQSIIAIQP